MENETITTIIRVIDLALANAWDPVIDKSAGKILRYTHGETQDERDALRELVQFKFMKNPKEYIFNHDFAKAFFGDEEVDVEYSQIEMMTTQMPLWKARLQEMVLEEDPIEYLEKFL